MNTKYAKTVMDTSCPGITFDKEGISNYFHDFNKFVKPVWQNSENGSSILKKYVNKIKKESR